MLVFIKRFTLLALLLLCLSTCKDRALLFGINDQIQLGRQTRDEILANPTEYGVVLQRNEYAQAYSYLDAMMNELLASPELRYRDRFEWEVRILHKPGVLNAFVTPGGYIFVYTDLIKYLDDASQLAGVMGHEIAHADREHSARNLERVYGIAILLDIVLGRNSSTLSQIAKQIALGSTQLRFSRQTETDADNFSVTYLQNSRYACNGAAGFFQKLKDAGQCSSFVWMSTHPDPCDRVENINSRAEQAGCNNRNPTESGFTYANFKAALP